VGPSAVVACCEPVLAEPLASDDAVELAAGFKVLADPTRLLLLSLIANSPSGEMCACDLVAPSGKSQPTVSHHLTILTDAGLVVREQRGKWAHFSVVRDRIAVLRDALSIEGVRSKEQGATSSQQEATPLGGS
jgi:ArsR family transcriptional regulator, arsenate/arsenite/antimonite-responsive transcriptional repressor